MAVSLACLLDVGLRWAGLRGLLWLMEARGLASEGLDWPGPVDKRETWVGRPVDKSEGFGGLGWPGLANRSEGFGGPVPRIACR